MLAASFPLTPARATVEPYGGTAPADPHAIYIPGPVAQWPASACDNLPATENPAVEAACLADIRALEDKVAVTLMYQQSGMQNFCGDTKRLTYDEQLHDAYKARVATSKGLHGPYRPSIPPSLLGRGVIPYSCPGR
jgi:hypothetical protein